MAPVFYLERQSGDSESTHFVLCNVFFPENCTFTAEEFMQSVEKKPNFGGWYFPREQQLTRLQEAIENKK